MLNVGVLLYTSRVQWVGSLLNLINEVFTYKKKRVFRSWLAWAAVLYHIWMDCNARMHDGKVQSEAEILHTIRQDARHRLCLCKNVKNTLKNRDLCSMWCIPFSVFDEN
jgi:hypothetical protein